MTIKEVEEITNLPRSNIRFMKRKTNNSVPKP